MRRRMFCFKEHVRRVPHTLRYALEVECVWQWRLGWFSAWGVFVRWYVGFWCGGDELNECKSVSKIYRYTTTIRPFIASLCVAETHFSFLMCMRWKRASILSWFLSHSSSLWKICVYQRLVVYHPLLDALDGRYRAKVEPSVTGKTKG